MFYLLMSWYFVTAEAVFRDGHGEVLRRPTGGLQFMRAWHKEWVVPIRGYFTGAGPAG